ncbi:MAG: SEL1-like repeat protein [Magnetococcales bacterium]|nr:SEL1-like repeat protein [Magnetococcales bacterium]
MFLLSFSLLLTLFVAALPGLAGEAPPPLPSAPSSPPVPSRQQERTLAIQQEQAARERDRRQQLSIRAEEKRAREVSHQREQQLRAAERQARIQEREAEAQLRALDRRQSELWKQALRREAQHRRQEEQRAEWRYQQWQAQMRVADNQAKMRALSEEAGARVADVLRMQEQKAESQRLAQRRRAIDQGQWLTTQRESTALRGTLEHTRRAQWHDATRLEADEQEARKRLKLLKQAAQEGNRHAQYQLGICYWEGKGVFQNDAKAFHWLRKAAEQGDAQAQWQVALAYHIGQGVAQNNLAAYVWNQRAIQGGEIRGFALRQRIIQQMGPVQQAQAQEGAR